VDCPLPNVRLPLEVCAAVNDVLNGSHKSLNLLFEMAGAPMPPPDAPHGSKWKVWLSKAGTDPDVDSLAVLGTVIEEFMDRSPGPESFGDENYETRRMHLTTVLEKHGFQYFPGGRVLLSGQVPLQASASSSVSADGCKPSTVDELLETVIRGLPRAMQPLIRRRKGAQCLSFASEYDIQDLLHSLLRPWVSDIRAEEYTPSYAGSSTRMDFLLPRYDLVLETKLVRNASHGHSIGDELIIDFEHYRRHPKCRRLWCVIYDPDHHILNQPGLIADLEGPRAMPDGTLDVRVFISAP
jgi:hypothetical protein